MNMNKKLIQKMLNFELFKNVDKELIYKNRELFREKMLKKESFIIFESDPGRCFYIILKGKVKIIISNIRGRKKVLATLKEGEFFGELSLFTNLPTSAAVQAVEDCQFIQVYKRDFERFLTISSKIPLNIIENLCHRLFKTDKQVGELIFASVQHRVIKFIVQNLNENKKDTDIIRLKINQKEMADIIGTSRELVNRVLVQLKKDGVIEYRSLKRINVKSIKRLKSYLQ